MSFLLLGFCFSVKRSFVVLKTPETVSTRDEDFKQSPGEACPILLLDMENVTCLRRAISFLSPKHTFRSSASKPVFIIDYYNSVG